MTVHVGLSVGQDVNMEGYRRFGDTPAMPKCALKRTRLLNKVLKTSSHDYKFSEKVAESVSWRFSSSKMPTDVLYLHLT